MRRLIRRSGLAVAAILLTAAPGAVRAGGAIEVEVNDPLFDPRVVNPSVGQAVHWSRGATSGAEHNVRQDEELFRSGNPTRGPIDYTRKFSAGSYHYYCEIHGSQAGGTAGGMSGYVRVKPKVVAEPTGRAFTVRWATEQTNTGSAFDVQYRVGDRSWLTWKSNTTTFGGIFGSNSSPVTVRSGTRYSFRARSQKEFSTSDWSPRKSFTP